ncbi:MAG: hypothetical protein ACK5L5_09585 [Bacteroidales bacterium]
MIFTFLFTADDDDDDFKLNIKIDATASFDTLNKSIQQSLGYKTDQLFTFQVPDEHGNLEVEISPMVYTEGDTSLPIGTDLDYVYSLKGILTMYVFDMINNRYLTMELTKIDENNSLDIPQVELVGTPPLQVLPYNENSNFSRSSSLDDFDNVEDLGEDMEDMEDDMFDGDDDDY